VTTVDGAPAEREGVGAPLGAELSVRVQRATGELAFRPGSEVEDGRGRRWSIDGDPGVLDAEIRDDRIESRTYPDALARLWAAATAPHAGDVVCSLSERYECVDWGGASHIGGGSHGSLHAGDSVAPLLLVGFEPGIEARRRQWALTDVAGLVLEHFGVAADRELVAA